jgi:hypothetical protein
MIVNSGFRGGAHIGTPRNMRGLHIHGYGASFGAFGEDTPTSGMYDQPLGPTYQPTSSSIDIGSTAAGIGSGIGSILTGIGSLFTHQQTPATYQGGYYPPSQSGGMDTTMLIGLGVVGVAAIFLLKK